MKKNKISIFIRRHTYLVTTAVCCAAVLILMAIYFVKGNKDSKEQYLADLNEITDYAEDRASEEEAVLANSVETEKSKNKTSEDKDNTSDKSKTTKQTMEESSVAAENTNTENQKAVISDEVTSKAQAAKFTDNMVLKWPLAGNVIMNYSMDKSIYFATLKQYKYNPALIIQGNVNDKITAAASGTVTQVETNEETGMTVTVDMGDGYEAVYGQLKDVQIQPDSFIESGSVLGYISEPTKYYSSEGSNLYFEVKQDGNPINPMNYLK